MAEGLEKNTVSHLFEGVAHDGVIENPILEASVLL